MIFTHTHTRASKTAHIYRTTEYKIGFDINMHYTATLRGTDCESVRDAFILFSLGWLVVFVGAVGVHCAGPAGVIISGSLQLFHLEKCN